MMVDLVFYNESYGGEGKIPASLFSLWEKRAEATLMQLSGGRIKGQENMECVRFCICEIAEFLYEQESLKGVKSESNDGYSVTYQERDAKREILKIAETYLSETDFLYRGVCDEA